MNKLSIYVTMKQILCAILINIPIFTFGTSIGWMSATRLLLQSNDSPTNTPLTDFELSWMTGVTYVITIPGFFLMNCLNEMVGRKITLIFISATAAASWVVLLATVKLWAFIISRALMGITMSGCFVVCPAYTREISEPRLHGVLNCLMIVYHTAGILFLYVLGACLSYRTTLWICLAFPTFHLILFMMMPESPYYLIKSCNFEEASRVLSWLRSKSESDESIKIEIIHTKREEIKSNNNGIGLLIQEIWNDHGLLKAFWLVLLTKLIQHLCGIVPIIYYAEYIFSITSKAYDYFLNPKYQSMLLGIICVSSSIIGSYTKRIKRKPLLVCSSLTFGLSVCIVASWFLVHDYFIQVPNCIPLALIGLCMFCAFTVFQPLPDIISKEMFDKKYRKPVMLITASIASFVDFIVLLFFMSLANLMGIHVTFYCFGITCIIIAVCVILFVPETKGKSLDDIYTDLGKSNKIEIIDEIEPQ